MSDALTEAPARKRPRRYSAAELAKVDVELTDASRVWLACNNCGQQWSPNILPGGKLPSGYWKCPNGCNVAHG